MKTCQHCGKKVGADAINGLCPECLMKVGIGSEVGPSATDETKASESTFVPPPNAPLSIEDVRKLFPQLEIIEQIGRGGMGVVYKARQPSLDRLVALKLLPTEVAKTPGFAERFAREARALARLSHPNIVAVHDSGNASGHFYFIMEYVDGANLRQMIASKQITPDAALSIVPKVCEALQYAHDEGILHRDIKPENILIDKKGRVKIADFGLAKLVDDQTTDHSLTGTHQVMGTPRYMAPEQFENTKTVDHRADIYSLGVVFYEMLTGEIPMGRFAVPSKKVQVDVRIDEVVLKSLEREPSQRYQHVSEVKSDVENVTHAGSGGTPAAVASRMGDRSVAPPAIPDAAPDVPAALLQHGKSLMIVGILLLGTLFIEGLVFVIRVNSGLLPNVNVTAASVAIPLQLAVLLQLIAGTLAIVAGALMRQCRCRGLAVASAILCIAVFLPVLVFVLAFLKGTGVWAVLISSLIAFIIGFRVLAVLRRTEIIAAFAREKERRALQGDASGASLSPVLIRSRVRDTGLLMTIAGIAVGLSGFIGFTFGTAMTLYFANTVTNPDDNVAVRAMGGAFMMLALTLCGIAVLVGGLAMRKLRFHGYALAMSVVLMALLPVCLMTMGRMSQLEWIFFQHAFALYAGIKAFRLLRKPEVEAAFESAAGIPATGKSAAANFQSLENAHGAGASLPPNGAGSPVPTPAAPPNQLNNLLGFWMTPQPGYAKAAGIPMLILTGIWLVVSLLVTFFVPQENENIHVVTSAAGWVLIPLAFLFLTLRWAVRRGQPASPPPATAKPFLGLPLWGLAVATALLAFVAVYLPKPGDLPEPPAAAQIFRPYLLLTPENNSYRFVGYENGEWKKHSPVFNVNRMVTAQQEVTRTLGWNSQRGPSFGFFKRDGLWTYTLVANHFDWKVGEKGPLSLPPGDLAKLRPMIVTQLELIGPERGARLTRLLDQGEKASTYVCWQNAVVLAAWISFVLFVFAFAKFLFTTRAGRITLCVVAGLIVLAIPFLTVRIPTHRVGNPAMRVGNPVASRPAEITEEPAVGVTNKLFRDFRYRVNASANQRATFWVELWRDGELQRAAGTTAGQSYDPPRGTNFEGRFIFSVFDAAEWGSGAAGQLIWDFTAESSLFDGTNASKNTKFKPTRSDALGANRKWIGNPFEDLEVRTSWGGKRSWTTVGGEPVTLLMLTGDPAGKAPEAVTDEATAKRSKVCLLLKVRFDFIVAKELKDASATRYLGADDIDYRGKPVAVPTTDARFVIAQDRSKIPATKTPGREEFAFTLSGPTGYTLKVWAEIWQEGRMSILGGLDYHIAPRGGQPIATSFALATMDGDVASVESKGMMRLDWGLDGAWNNNQWRTNIFKGMGAVHRSWDREPRKWNPRPGEAVTILSITGYKISEFRSAMSVFTEADLIKGWPNAAIIVRAQFVPAKPGEIRDGEGPSVGINGLLNRIGNGTIPFAQFEIAKQLGVDVSRCQMPAEAHALLVAAASTKEGQESAVKMLGEFLSEVGYSTSNPDKRFVIEPMDTLWWRARKGQTVNAEELVTVLERFTEDLNTGFRGVWWNKPEPIIKGENGPQLSDATAKLLKLTKPQHEEANKIFQKYAQEARALERRNTKIEKNDKGHVLVTISHYSTQCLALASNLVAELGGIVPQNILPAIRPGGLPAVVFGSAGECRTEIEMWKEEGKYHLNVRSRDWLPAPGMIRNDSSFSNVGPDVGTFYGDYRLYWTEE